MGKILFTLSILILPGCTGAIYFEKVEGSQNIYFRYNGFDGIVHQVSNPESSIQYFDVNNINIVKDLLYETTNKVRLFIEGGDKDEIWINWNSSKNIGSVMTDEERGIFRGKLSQLKWQYSFVLKHDGTGTVQVTGFMGTEHEWRYVWNAPLKGLFDEPEREKYGYLDFTLVVNEGREIKLGYYRFK